MTDGGYTKEEWLEMQKDRDEQELLREIAMTISPESFAAQYDENLNSSERDIHDVRWKWALERAEKILGVINNRNFVDSLMREVHLNDDFLYYAADGNGNPRHPIPEESEL